VSSQPVWAPWKMKKKTKKDKKSNVHIFSVVKEKFDFTFLPMIRVPWPGKARFFKLIAKYVINF
jgi:hypothetical protein